MNTPSQLFRRFLIGTIAVSSIFIAIVLFTSRSNVPGKRILQPLHGINLTTNETFETQIPFYVDDLGFQSDDIIELSIPIEAHNHMLQPALLIERPLHFVEVHLDDKPLTPPLEARSGARSVLVPFDNSASGTLKVFVTGEFGRGGLAENAYFGELEHFQKYIQLRTASAILAFAILIFTTLSLLMLVFIRPNYRSLLSAAAFFFGLTMVILSGIELWYLISDSVYYQVRLKTFSIYLTIAMALQVMSSFSELPKKMTRIGTIILTAISLVSLVLPSMDHVQTAREAAYILSVPFSLFSLLYAIRYYNRSGSDTRVFFWICGILLFGGTLDLLTVFKVWNIPPSMPIASALFAVIATVLLFIRSSDLANRYRTLVDHSTDAILILNDQFVILELNDQAECFGLHRDRAFKAVVVSSSATLESHLKSRLPVVELHLDDPNLLFESIAIQLENNLSMVVLRNITERKRAESQLLTKTRFETANLIASSVAHDFSNLMMAVEGQLSILGKHIEQSQHGRFSEVENLLSQGNLFIRRIQNIVQSDFSVASAINPNQIIEGLLSISRQPFLSHIQIHFQPQGVSHTVRFNSEAFEQVIFNLILNAKDALVDQINPQVWIDDNSQNEWFVLHIEDSGPGIPEDLMNQIFEPFVTSKAAHEGSGLGLTVAKRLVVEYGGDLAITNSKYGQGAAFLLSLPLVDGQIMAASTFNSDASILILEDEPLILEVLEEILQEAGYKVFPCQTIEDAEGCFAEHEIKLLISDVILKSESVEDGFEYANRAVEEEKVSNVLMMSGYIPDNITGLPDTWSFLQKPFQRKILLERIETILCRASSTLN